MVYVLNVKVSSFYSLKLRSFFGVISNEGNHQNDGSLYEIRLRFVTKQINYLGKHMEFEVTVGDS
jgi:hypothetical protein